MPGSRPPRPGDVPIDTREIRDSGRFEMPIVRRYSWKVEYTTAAYIDLLSTYSANLVLEPEVRQRLFTCIGDLIDSRYGGRITKPYITELQVGRLSP